MPNQVVQFDLAYNISENALNSTNFGRKRPPQDMCKNIKDALKWESPEEPDLKKNPLGRTANKKPSMTKKNEILMERSPEKWKTMYRDQYRKFAHSPMKQDINED